MHRHITLFLLIFLVPHLLSAQADLSFEEQNAQIYENLDFSEVSTGMLMDKGLSIFDLTLFDGDPSKDTVVVLKDMGEFLYGTVQDCGTTTTLPLRNYQEIKDHIDTLKKKEAVKI